jgi:hypothetical protein
MTNRQVACETDVTKAVLVFDNDREQAHPCIGQFREAIKGVPLFLCTFHVLQDWVKNIRCKLHNKNKYRKTFDAMYSILFLKVVGMSRDCAAAVQ